MPETVRTTGRTGTSGSDAAGSAQDKTKEVASQARDTAQGVASQAQEKAREAASQGRGRLREQVDQRSTQVGDQISSGAGDVRSVAQELRQQGKETPARYVEQTAERAERLGGYLRDSDGDRILGDVEEFARSNTWAVALGGLALGFAASRLLKASSTERYRSSLEPARAGALTSPVGPASTASPVAPASTGVPAGPGTASSRSEWGS